MVYLWGKYVAFDLVVIFGKEINGGKIMVEFGQ